MQEFSSTVKTVMGEMAYVGSPSRGSSSFPYSRTAPSLVEEISAAQFSNSNVRGIEEDLALIRQGEQRAQQQPPSDEGELKTFHISFVPLLITLMFAHLDTEDASETDQQKKEDEYTEMREQ